MDTKTHMLQDESKSDPLLQIESGVESKTDVPVNAGVSIELEKSVKAEIGLDEDVCTIHHMEGLEFTKQVDKEVERVEKNDDKVLNFQVKPYMVSPNDKVISKTRGVTWSDISVQKFENKGGISQVDGEKGGLLEEKVDKYHDTIDISGECHLLFAPTKEDIDESTFFNISSNSFMIAPFLQVESDEEEPSQTPMNEGVYGEDDKSTKVEIGLCGAICTIDQMEGLKSTKEVDGEVTRVDKKDDGVVNHEDKTHVVSQDDEVTNDTRGDKGSDTNVAKLDSKDEKSTDGANGASLEERGDKYHDTNDIIGETLLFPPIEEDWESAMFNISNSSFQFDPLLQIESEVEPNFYVAMNEGLDIAEETSGMLEIELGKNIFTIDQIEGLKNTSQLDLDIERVEEKGDDVLNFEDKAYVVSMNDKVISDTRGDDLSDVNVGKIENNEGISKMDGKTSASLQEKSYKYHENNDINRENYLISSPKKKDMDESSFVDISNNAFMFDYTHSSDDSGTKEEQEAFLKELEHFHKNTLLQFKVPKFYGEDLNYLKLWRKVARLGGYDQVTSRKMWRQVGESFNPPRTCRTVSWSFRNFYEKVLLEYEKHKTNNGKFKATASTLVEQNASEKKAGESNLCGRVRRESATRAMQNWHSQKPQKNGSVKRKRIPTVEDAKCIQHMPDKQENKSTVIDVGPRADWVKIDVLRTEDSYEVYALTPGLACEELHVQSDPTGRLIITGQPAQVDNPWGITRFKKVIVLPSRIDPSQTAAFLNLHGRSYVSAVPQKPKSQ